MTKKTVVIRIAFSDENETAVKTKVDRLEAELQYEVAEYDPNYAFTIDVEEGE